MKVEVQEVPEVDTEVVEARVEQAGSGDGCGHGGDGDGGGGCGSRGGVYTLHPHKARSCLAHLSVDPMQIPCRQWQEWVCMLS